MVSFKIVQHQEILTLHDSLDGGVYRCELTYMLLLSGGGKVISSAVQRSMDDHRQEENISLDQEIICIGFRGRDHSGCSGGVVSQSVI